MSMDIMSMIQRNQTSTNQTSQKPLVLNEGQMIHGKIQQLHPGQLAEVQVGNHKMLAKLEVPMRAGDSYYFQVTAIKPEVQLKIIAGPTSAQLGTSGQLQNLMEAMQLPKSPEMTTLLSFIINEKIPMSRDNIIQAAMLLQKTSPGLQQDALLAIQKLADLKLPMTETLFRSIFAVQSNEGFHGHLQNLQGLLQTDLSLPNEMRNHLLQILGQLEKPLANLTGQAMLGKALTSLFSNEQSPEARFSILQLLKETSIIPRQASLPNLQHILTTGIAKQANLPTGLSQNLTATQLQNVTQFLSSFHFLTEGERENLITIARTQGFESFVQSFARTVGEAIVRQPTSLPNESIERIFSLFQEARIENAPTKMNALMQRAESSTNQFVGQLVQQAESTVSSAINGQVMKDTIQSIFQTLGLNYEATLLNNEAQPERFLQMLKPQLIALLNDANVSQQLREAAEQFVVRMNGAPLTSTESGVNQQLIMQVPLQFFGKKIDATLQWNGRMKENRKIDADFARILFYLNLHSLKETVVDMQVQNRIVTITVFNEDQSLQAIGKSLETQLKEGLDAIGYQLSGVFYKGFVEEKKRKAEKPPIKDVFEGGVDFRI